VQVCTLSTDRSTAMYTAAECRAWWPGNTARAWVVFMAYAHLVPRARCLDHLHIYRVLAAVAGLCRRVRNAVGQKPILWIRTHLSCIAIELFRARFPHRILNTNVCIESAGPAFTSSELGVDGGGVGGGGVGATCGCGSRGVPELNGLLPAVESSGAHA
jgi:hypothetical protein